MTLPLDEQLKAEAAAFAAQQGPAANAVTADDAAKPQGTIRVAIEKGRVRVELVAYFHDHGEANAEFLGGQTVTAERYFGAAVEKFKKSEAYAELVRLKARAEHRAEDLVMSAKKVADAEGVYRSSLGSEVCSPDDQQALHHVKEIHSFVKENHDATKALLEGRTKDCQDLLNRTIDSAEPLVVSDGCAQVAILEPQVFDAVRKIMGALGLAKHLSTMTNVKKLSEPYRQLPTL
jgi:hypothetical protein